VKSEFQDRFSEALRRRLYPRTGVHLKQIAGAIQRSETTISRWWQGESGISGHDLMRIAQFFSQRGDDEFIAEIFGGLIGGVRPSPEVERQVVDLVRTALSNFDRREEKAYWCFADGKMAAVADELGKFVMRSQRLPDDVGDVMAYAVGMLGWIAIVVRPEGVATVYHHGTRVRSAAAHSVCEWLERDAGPLESVRRRVRIDNQWIDAHHPSAATAALALAKAASIVRVPRRAWMVKPLPFDSITNERLALLLRVYHQEPEHIIHAAAMSGAFTTSSVLRVDGEDVILHHAPTGFGWTPQNIEGNNVLSRADTEYGLMIHARVLEAWREGPAYHELIGTIEDHNVRYLSLTIPERGQEGRVLTSSVLLEDDGIVA
jgi:transcriptional regulator with XRE-family HTH domain